MKSLLYILTASTILSSCTDYKSQIAQLQNEKQKLIQNAAYKDSTINDFVSSINEIENGINAITEKKKLVASETGNEVSTDAKARIQNRILEIDELLQNNKEKISALSKKLKNASFKIDGLEKMIADLNAQISTKDTEMLILNNQISSLNQTVNGLNTQVADLNKIASDKSTTIEKQTSKINTAYYAAGTYKELEAKKVVVKDGGFLGLGKAQMVKKDFDRNAFATIDITKLTSIPLKGDEVELLTNHPSDSYTLKVNATKTESTLEINNPEKFWSASKYLVLLESK